MESKSAFKNSGFTLIELLVSILVVSILVGLGYTNFRAYSQKQALWAAARQVEGDLRLAQSYAMSGKDASCGSQAYFYGYNFYRNSATSYSIRRVCRLSGANYYTSVVNVNMPNGFEIADSSVSIVFRAVTGGTDGGVSFRILRSGTSNPYVNISVSTSGKISMTYAN